MTFDEWWNIYSRNDFRRSDEIARDAWTAAVENNFLVHAVRKIVRVHGNGQPKQLDDAVLLLKVAMAEYEAQRVICVTP